MEGKPNSKLRYPKDCYDSILLPSVDKILSTILTTDENNAHILQKISSWEKKTNFNDVFHQYISSMWELPEIGNFLAILFKKLDLDIINQGEIERMFLMPKESTTMGKVMTTLLMPIKKPKYIGQVMPYKVWSEKLSKKVSDWFKVYHTKNQNKVIVMNLLGIHPDFWAVVNEKNPLIEKDYSELSYFVKVWLVKGLCDYVTVKFKTINDIITNCNVRQCTIWKNDLETEEYFFFDSMPDLRIYYYNIPYDEPSLEFLKSVNTYNEVITFEDNLTMYGCHTIQKRKHFKLIADSIERLRAFVYEMDMEGKSAPKSLITSLDNFIVNIESKESNYIAMNNDSKIKLFKDWISYSDRIQKNQDNISVWEEKDSKSIVKAKNEELIIVGKRQRKSIVRNNFVTNESDEYFSENDKSLTNFTDSEDEWGAVNQPKNKAKQPKQKTLSKVELENQISEANIILKNNTNNLLDNMQIDEFNQHNITLVYSKNKSHFKERDSKSIDQAQYKGIILQKPKGKIVERQDFESDKYVRENDKSLSNFTDSEDEWGAMNQLKYIVKQPQQIPSKLFLELEKQATEAGKILRYDINQSDENQLRDEDKISKSFKNKVCKTNKEDKSIKPVKLLKTQNEVKCSNNTNTLVNGNNKVKKPLQTTPKHIKLDKCLSEEDTILKHRSNKVFDTNTKDKSIKPVKLLKTQNEVKCSNNTNTLVNGNNKVKKPLQTTPKHIKLDKCLSEEDTILKHRSNKVFDTNTKDKSIKPVKLLKTQNDVKCSNNTNTLVNGNNKVKKPLQTTPKHIKLDKFLSEEDAILKHRSNKVFDTNTKDKSIKSVKLLKTQNEIKCSINTNTLVNGNNKVKKPLQTTPKHIKLDKCLSEEDTILKHRSNKVFDTNLKDKSIKSVKLLKTQNEIKCSINTNTLVNGNNQRLVDTKNVDDICSYEKVVLIDLDKEEKQKSPDGLKRVEIINLEEDMQSDCKVFNHNLESSISSCTENKNKNRKTNEHNNDYKQIESAVILIEDDDGTISSDDEDAVQFISMTRKPEFSPLKNNKSCTVKTNLNKSHNTVSASKRITLTNYIKHKAKSSIINQLSSNITITPANVNIPKGIEVTMVKTPRTKIECNFNSIKKKSTMSNDHPQNNPSTINVKCEIISKPNLNGEVKFYVRLPNGSEHPGPNELINQYLKQHNNHLPDYWLVPLPVDVAKQYGFI